MSTARLLAPLALCAGLAVALSHRSAPATPAPAATVPVPVPALLTSSSAALAPAESLPSGVYGTVCVTCHQANGQGMEGAFPPLAGSEIVNGPAERQIAIVLWGLTGPITVKGKKYNSIMSPWNSLSDADIATTITYERQSWGNTASAVTPAQVAAVRALTKNRKQSWTWDELSKAKLN